MKLMILRHLESEKNLMKSFSSNKDDFALTNTGISEGNKLARAINLYLNKFRITCSEIHTAKSVRAIETAKIIGEEINCNKIIEWDNLRSTKSGALLGKTESEAMKINPLFMEQLKLFRCGLFSSYNFEKIHDKEDKKEFEKRVNACLDTILTDDIDIFKLIVVHHSTLTALMIRFAREYYNYPIDFYGKVDCGFGNFYLIDIKNKGAKIELCNASYEDLINL